MRTILLDALQGSNRARRPPVWLMRQAGRYQPRYQALRDKYSLLELFRCPERLVEVTLLPVQEFDPDAAILFSDILIVLDAFNIPWDVHPGVGPVVQQLSKSLSPRPVQEALSFVYEGIRLLRRDLKVPLIGFCGGPFTVGSYLLEGGTSRTFSKSKRWLLEDGEGYHAFLATLTDCLIDHLLLQAEAGCSVLQLFDSWSGTLSPQQFDLYCQKHLRRIVEAPLGKPLIIFVRASASYVERLADLGLTALGVDWTIDLKALRSRLGSVTLQGNLDPAALLADEQSLTKEARGLLDQMGSDPAYIFNLGHGVLPQTPPERVRQLIDLVKAYAD